MTPEQYRVVRDYFHQIIDLDLSARASKLNAISSAPVRDEVRKLLNLSETSTTFIDTPLFAPAGALRPGEIVGRFRIVRQIGKGGMGEVFEAQDLKFSCRYALKTIAPEWLGDQETASHFERETKIGRTVNHPNVCRVYEYLEETRGPYVLGMIVMEFVDGETLQELVTRNGPLPPQRVLAITAQILDGLEAAHNCAVIHRDLKPSNVMLQNTGRAVLMDFGLARYSTDDSHTKKLRGTPSYMAPEQFNGESTARSDIYALGLLIHFMLSGQRSPAREKVPAAWRDPLRKCTAPISFDRYASVAELRRALYRRGTWTRRGWAAVATAAGISSIIVWREQSTSALQVAAGTPLTVERIDNRTGDKALDSVEQVLLTILQQSPKLRVFEADSAPPNHGLTLHATLLPRREGISLSFQLRSFAGATRTRLFEAGTRADLFAAVHRACHWVRQTVGESAQDLAELDLHPESATTSSWEALLAFTRGQRDASSRQPEAALLAFDEALRLDPKFALASMRKGDILTALGRDAEALQTWRNTIELASRQRLTRLEDFRIRSMFASDAWDFATAAATFKAYADYYPHDVDARRFSALPLLFLNRGEEALQNLRRALEIDPDNAGAHAQSGLFGVILGHFGFANDHLAKAAILRPAMAARVAEVTAFIQGRYAEVDDWYQRALQGATPEQKSVVQTQHAHILAELGRWQESERLLTTGLESDVKEGRLGEATRKRMSLLIVRLRSSNQERDSDVQALLGELLPAAGPWIRAKVVSALARAGCLASARALARRAPPLFDIPLVRYAAQRSEGEIKIAEGRLAEGLAHLQEAAAALPPAWPREFLAWAAEKARRPDAVDEYRRVVAAKGILWVNVYLERPGIWADTVGTLARMDAASASTYKQMLSQVRG